MAKLHEISADFLAIQDEDLPDDVLADTLEAIEGEFEVKAENIVRLVENWNSDIKELREYKKTIDAKIKARTNRIDGLKDYLRNNMEATGINKIESPIVSVTCGKPTQQVEIYDEKAIPDEFMKVYVEQKPLKKEILAALKEGQEVPGATLVTGKPSIRIK